MMLTEQEVSEIMIERIMTIETSRNLEKIQVLDQVHLMKRPRDNGGFRSSDSRNDNDRNYGNQNQQPSRNEGFRSVSPQRSENQNRGNDAVRSGGFRNQGQENKASENRSLGNGRGNGNGNGNRGGGFR